MHRKMYTAYGIFSIIYYVSLLLLFFPPFPQKQGFFCVSPGL